MTKSYQTYTPGTPRTHTVAAALMLVVAIAALSAGGWIYVVGRPGTIIYNISHASIVTAQAVDLPDFVRYSLPDGLWSMSSILVLHPLLRNEPALRRIAIVAIVPLLGIISEILQWVGWLPGVFDICDLACYALPLLTYLFCQSYFR